MSNKEIASTIWKQMNSLDRMLIWAMGTHSPMTIQDGLQISVRGRKHRGVVQIKLNGKDLYDVSFYRGQKAIKTINDLYAESLMPILGVEVEGD